MKSIGLMKVRSRICCMVLAIAMVFCEVPMSVHAQEIAERLDMSINTVKFHLSSLMSKTGCVSRTELAIRAAQSGLIVNSD